MTPQSDHSQRSGNRLLAALPDATYAVLQPHLTCKFLELKHILYDVGQPIKTVSFPIDAVLSMINIMQDGSAVEVGTVGNEGMVGLPVFLHADSMPNRTFAQIPGQALHMRADIFQRAATQPGPLQFVMQRYTQSFLNQVAQNAACNRLHPIQQRCARWLLMTHDRVGADAFPLTHEFLSFMLGVRRAGVTEAAGRLQRAGLITYQRGIITVLNRPGLEQCACECYQVVQAEYTRLLG